MSKKKNKDGKKQPTGDYKSGYCRTPKKSWWKPGCKSPNPSGRPPGKKSMEAYIYDELSKEMNVKTPDGKEKLEARIIAARRYVEALLKAADLKHFQDAFRIEAKEEQRRSEMAEDKEEDPMLAAHRFLAYFLNPSEEEFSPEDMEKLLFPNGRANS